MAQSKAGPTKEELAVAQSQVALALATVADLEAQLAKTTLTSPVDGIARLLVAEHGEAISPGQPVLTLAVAGDRWFTFTIREDRLQGLTMGSKIALQNGRRRSFRSQSHRTQTARRIRGLARGARGRRPRHQQLSSARRSDRPDAEARAGHDGVDRRGAGELSLQTADLRSPPTHCRALPPPPCPDMPAAISEQFRNSHGRAPVHLSYARSLQDLSGRQEGPRQRQPLLLPGRENRRARRQRLGQIDASAHHGRARHRVHRRRLRRRGRQGRLSAAGA